MRPRLLILGGTGEAADLARAVAAALPGLDAITSLAGRTAAPPMLPGQMRIGGFGGADGLLTFLRTEAIGLVADATHPFAARISAHAAAACAAAGLPRLVLRRPDWPRLPGDRWIEAADMAEAAARLPKLGRRAFLAVGRQDLAAFAAVKDMDLVVRLLTAESPPLPGCTVVTGRGPFRVEDETALLAAHRVEVVVSKAAGGEATYAKIAAARRLGLPVLLIRRPPPPPGPTADDVPAAVAWIAATCAAGGCDPRRTAANR